MKQLRISFLGLDAWESNFIRAAIDIASGTDIAQWGVEDSPERADLLLIRPDVEAGANALRRLDGASRPLVVLCADPADLARHPERRVLARPVRYPELMAVLRDAQATLRASTPAAPAPVVPRPEPARMAIVTATYGEAPAASPAGTSVESDLHGAAEKQVRRFLPNTRLLGLIQRALSQGEAVEFAHPDYPLLTVLPGDECYLCTSDPATLQDMFRTPAWAFTSNKPDPGRLRSAGKQAQRPLWRLMYFAALFGSEGHLAGHAAIEDRLRLVSDPDLSGLHAEPVHAAIINHLRDRVADVTEIARAVNANLETVVSFCTACEYAGFIHRIPEGQEPEMNEGALRRRVNDMLLRLRGLFV